MPDIQEDIKQPQTGPDSKPGAPNAKPAPEGTPNVFVPTDADAKATLKATAARDAKIKAEIAKDTKRWPKYSVSAHATFRAQDDDHAKEFAKTFKDAFNGLAKSEYPNDGVSVELFERDREAPTSKKSISIV